MHVLIKLKKGVFRPNLAETLFGRKTSWPKNFLPKTFCRKSPWPKNFLAETICSRKYSQKNRFPDPNQPLLLEIWDRPLRVFSSDPEICKKNRHDVFLCESRTKKKNKAKKGNISVSKIYFAKKKGLIFWPYPNESILGKICACVFVYKQAPFDPFKNINVKKI